MAWGPGPLTQSHPNTVAMPKRGKRLKFRAQDACSGKVTVVNYANSDRAVMRSGGSRVKVQESCRQCCSVRSLPGSCSGSSFWDWWALRHHRQQWGDWCPGGKHPWENYLQRKEKQETQRRLGWTGGEEYPMDIWLLLASYICPEDIMNFPLICKNAWTSLALLPFGWGCTSLSAFAPVTRVGEEAALSSGMCDPISVPYVWAICCSNLRESSHSRKYF